MREVRMRWYDRETTISRAIIAHNMPKYYAPIYNVVVPALAPVWPRTLDVALPDNVPLYYITYDNRQTHRVCVSVTTIYAYIESML